MRFYLYLDKKFLKILFSTNEKMDFDIEVVECSIRKSNSVNNILRVEPRSEKICDDENLKREDIKDNISCNYKEGNVRKEGMCISYGFDNNRSEQTERRFINIDDITDMKNNNFYHILIENMINDNIKLENSRIIVINDFIKKYDGKLNEININKNNGFFTIDEYVVWFDRNLLISDIDLLITMSCKVTVIGYVMNCLEIHDVNFIKAIAIYIS